MILLGGFFMLKILLAEDERHLRDLIKTYLSKQGFDVLAAKDGEEAYALFLSTHIDLIITDIMMPNKDGYALAEDVRASNEEIPIMMLTALEDIRDKEKGFHLGIDDYMVKPVNLKELVLRIKALLKRYKIMLEHKITLANFSMDQQSNECIVHGQVVNLSNKEFMLLFKLLSNPNRIFTREQLMNEIWGYDSESLDRTVDTHIKRLREHVVCEDFTIVTVRGLGYKAVMS
jgi:DNA-binding response OmpR family regulator